MFDEQGMPRYRYAFVGLPRKNGKTELAAAIVLYLIFGSELYGQNIYSASGDAKQAALIHKAAADMIQQDERLSAVARVYRGNDKQIRFEPNNSAYEALSSEAYSKHGLRPSVNVFDEVHVFPNRDLHGALETAYGATKRPFTLYITTAGWDRTSLCYELWDRARAAQADPKSDPRFLAILYEFRDGDDWGSEEAWKRINPGLGKFRSLENLREDFDRAQRFPIYENEFRQLYLNQWTQQAKRWIAQATWAACSGIVDRGRLRGRTCYAGFDKGVTGDMSAFARVFPEPDGSITLLLSFWAPRDGKWRDELRNHDRYTLWAREGFLTFTDGSATDGGKIERDIVAMNEETPIRQLDADQAYASELLGRLLNVHGINVKAINQGPVRMNEPTVKFEELVLAGKVNHGGHPILAWNVANASLKRYDTGLVHMLKNSSTERIDGLAAVLNALAAMTSEPPGDEVTDLQVRWL